MIKKLLGISLNVLAVWMGNIQFIVIVNIVIQSTKFSGSEFYNYKGTFSIVLFAVVDANYNFIYVYIGAQGRMSDGGVFKNTGFAQALDHSTLNLPLMTPLNGRNRPVPHVFVADDAFPLTRNIMKPYPGHHDRGSNERQFNYRLSRARRVVESVFRILASVVRVLRKPMLLAPDNVEKVVLTCTLLHNYLRRNEAAKCLYTSSGTFDVEDIDTGLIRDGTWRKDVSDFQSFQSIKDVATKFPQESKEIRNEFSEFVNSDVG